MFISFEGIDAAGKTTQIEAVADWLDKHHIALIKTREPGGTEMAEKIREFVLNQPLDSAMAEALLMNAARHLHVKNVILPALVAQKWVLCDRYCHSTYVYQAEAGVEKLQQLHYLVTDGLMPDVTFILDISVELSEQRCCGGDVFEKRTMAYKQQLRDQYHRLAQHDKRMHIIDAHREIQVITEDICTILYEQALPPMKEKLSHP